MLIGWSLRDLNPRALTYINVESKKPQKVDF